MRLFCPLIPLALAAAALAQNPSPPAPPRRIPPPGLTLTTTERQELAAGIAALRRDLDALAGELEGEREARLGALLPDVEIFHKAVDWALRYDEFMAPKEIAFARRLLETGRQRAADLRARRAPWLDATGLVLRGYRSKLDGSVQPYGLVVPAALPGSTRETPLLVWLLGRGERRTELAFLAEREAGPPPIVPQGALVLVPYGRFCNATKFAGEVDVAEAMSAVRAHYRVDARRIAVAGFSMGGGSTWHLAAHHSGLWCAASPGAGFADTPIYTKAHAPNKEPRPPWEQRLWRFHECPGIAANFFNLPTLAYTGELDAQKEASELMAAAFAREGLTLERFIGPQTAHRYHPETKEALTRRLEELIAQGRPAEPREVWLATYTLRYPEAAWLRIEGMREHWERAEARGTLHDNQLVDVTTKNVTALSFPGLQATTVRIDGQNLEGGAVRFTNYHGRWRPETAEARAALRKRPGLTGPIDDAFMEPFLFVRPSGKPLGPQLGAWVESELTAARHLWRDVFRGDAPVKADSELTPDDIAAHHLVLWGDPSSNRVLAKILPQLPLQWDARSLTFRGQTYPAINHAPILVFPNPLNPRRYVVLNSGIDFRTDAYGSNALQTPKLPDWAIVDLRTPPGPRWPGKIVDAGFFDEEWK